jgi:exopolysaccharide production protein ExoZ
MKEFLLRRAIRTPPLYYIFTLVVFAIFVTVPQLADGEITLRRLAASLTFFPLNDIQPVIAIGWTLNYEMFFYAITAISVVLPYPGARFSVFLF